MIVKIKYARFTSAGGRDVNEDSINVLKRKDKYCFVLCDGLGGHGMGDVASSLVVNEFGKLFSKNKSLKTFLNDAFTGAQKVLLTKQDQLNAQNKMKTTSTAVVMDKRDIYLGHIGDSRIYVFANNKICFRTMDHSVPQMLVQTKEISESEIRNHPDRNKLLRVLGIESSKQLFELHNPFKTKKVQSILLCSDGFWELIDDEAMCVLLKHSNNVEDWLKSMLEVVRKNGFERNMDNYSAIAVWCHRPRGNYFKSLKKRGSKR